MYTNKITKLKKKKEASPGFTLPPIKGSDFVGNKLMVQIYLLYDIIKEDACTIEFSLT